MLARLIAATATGGVLYETFKVYPDRWLFVLLLLALFAAVCWMADGWERAR